MTKPNFIFVGPDKAGSTWLHEVLLTHPQVWMPQAKDLYFFDRYFDRGSDWYLAHFAPAGARHAVVGEVCQDYLFHPLAAQRIQATLGSCRFMVTLRDPADRAFSSWLYMQKMGEPVGSFVESLTARPELVEHGRYATGLHRFVERFGRDSLHVAVFDDLVADPQAFVDALWRFLGVAPHELTPAQLEAQLPAAAARSAALARLARAGADLVRERLDHPNLVGLVKRNRLVHRVLYRPLGADRPVMTGDDRAAVHAALGAEVAELDRVLGLGLARRWGWPQG